MSLCACVGAQVVEEMTFIERSLFVAIQPWEFLAVLWNSSPPTPEEMKRQVLLITTRFCNPRAVVVCRVSCVWWQCGTDFSFDISEL